MLIHRDKGKIDIGAIFLGGLFGFIVALFVIHSNSRVLKDIMIVGSFVGGSILCFTMISMNRLYTFFKNENEEKNKLISFVSHEMRKSLTAFKWGLKMLLNGAFGPLLDEQKSTIQNLFSESEAAINLTNDFLDIAKLELHKLEIVLKPLSLEAFQRELTSKIERYIQSASEKNIAFTFRIKLGSELFVHIDLARISQVVDNLIENALNYTPSGGKVTIKVFNSNELFTFSIQDTGIGILSPDRKKIFQEFFRSDNAKKMRSGGSGIGLYLCKRYIAGHEGNISFESKEGKGSAFTFILPIRPSEPVEEVFKAI